MKKISIAALCIFISLAALAQTKTVENVTIEDFAWLAGQWKGDGFGGISEEIWSAPAGGAMMGMYRHTKEDKVTFYEFMHLIEEEDGIKIKIKHFQPDMAGWETKDEHVTFPLLSATEKEFIFDGYEWYLLSEDELKIKLKIRNGDKIDEEEFHFTRVKRLDLE